MAKTRIELQEALEDFLGSHNVWYQPPETIKLKYPCIIYELGRIDQVYADNRTYLKNKSYTLTLIHREADSTLPDDILDAFEGISFDRPYKADNLYHEVYTLNW